MFCCSDPKHTMSGPYIDLLTRRAKTDPLDEKMLTEDWRVPEYELDMKISEASVMCCFVYRGIVLQSPFAITCTYYAPWQN